MFFLFGLNVLDDVLLAVGLSECAYVNQGFQHFQTETLSPDSWPTKKHDQFLKTENNSNFF